MHPNVDKKSFIRAKQNKIHQERLERKHQIEALKYERIINDGLLTRIETLLAALKKHGAEAKSKEGDVDQLVFQALLESAGDPSKDQAPPPPAGIQTESDGPPRYSKMMAGLLDQVRRAVDETKQTDRFQAIIDEIGSHEETVLELQQQLLVRLAELEKEDKGKITSADIHYGFDSSSVSKSAPGTKASPVPELLNPSRPSVKPVDGALTSGSEADLEDDDEEMNASALAKQFGQISFGDYKKSLDFISNNPSIVKEKETDGLLVEAFNAQSEGKEAYARQCVHQALLIQYCRQLGKDGVGLFFKRVTTPGHQAQKLFMDDVNTTYARIRSRTKELEEERQRDEAEGRGGVEQIQLHAVDPNTSIHIVVPPADGTTEDEKQARQIFETFPPGLQRALESGKLDKINEVLGKMSVDEAEEVVEKLGNGGMLSVEQGVIDATTEEGRKQMEEIERSGKMPELVEEEEAGDPGMD